MAQLNLVGFPRITSRQLEGLQFIADYIEREGFAPSLREIGEHMGISSTNGVTDHLKALEKKGFLRRGEAKSRALQLAPGLVESRAYHAEVDAAPGDSADAGERGVGGPVGAASSLAALSGSGTTYEIPILGRVAAGQPILAEENINDRVTVDRFFLGALRASEVFGLVVQGDSMINDGIHSGDYLFVRKQARAESGEIVVAMVEGEATCKRYFHEGSRVRLQPANDYMEPIYVDARDFRQIDILGKVVGVYRRLDATRLR